jgi:hypothetical protein
VIAHARHDVVIAHVDTTAELGGSGTRVAEGSSQKYECGRSGRSLRSARLRSRGHETLRSLAITSHGGGVGALAATLSATVSQCRPHSRRRVPEEG